jgi:FMN-dependent NADH-azoreductase
MKELLFVNACIREQSRTEELSRQYLKTLENEFQIEEIKLTELDLKPLDAAALKQRDEDCSAWKLQSQKYCLAQQFAAADCIVIAAPYWDCLFPAILRIYLEQICVVGITFAYDENGTPVKTCLAERLVYITSCGGFLPEHAAVKSLVFEMGKLFSIEDVRFYAAEGLDVFPDKTQDILSETLHKMLDSATKSEHSKDSGFNRR